MSAKAGKRPLRSLTAHEKLDAIRRVHDGESKASVARDIGVPESTLRGWCKNEDKISYLSRQSSPDTDESLERPTPNKRVKLEESVMQPFNLSLKTSGGTSYSPNSEARYNLDYIKTEMDKTPLNLNTKTETPKVANHISERERNRAELARLSVELGLNRPEMFLPTINSASTNLADLSANIGLLAQWNSLLMQQQQKAQQANKSKVPPAPADASNQVSSSGLLTTVDQQKHLPKEKQSVHESVWYWLKTQQSMLNLSQNPTSLPTSMPNGVSTSGTTASTSPITSMAGHANIGHLSSLNDVCPDQSSWFWKWYKQFAYQHQQPQANLSVADKPILYQQLTKETQQQQKEGVPVADQQNAENLSVHEDKAASRPTSNGVINSSNNKARSVLDNLLFNNNNNVAVNKRDGKEEEDGLSQMEALEHGEKFLRWLEACSDPSVTAMQIMQFRTLLNNVKAGADRRNGDLQNKAKVKRK